MADVNRGNRPLSPHLTIYRPQMNSIMSIMHRISGLSMLVAGIMIVWWLLAASTSQTYFQFVDDLVTSWIGGLILLLSTFALWYHFCNGLRHIVWDLGYGFEPEALEKSGYAVLGGAAFLTFVTLFFVW